jgi:hypothetical protein
MSLSVADLQDALHNTTTEPNAPPADAGEAAANRVEAAEDFEKACGVRAISSDEETDRAMSDDEWALENVSDQRKQELNKKLETAIKSIVEHELVSTANDLCVDGGWPRLLLDLRKPHLTQSLYEKAEEVLDTATYNPKFFRTMEKLVPVRFRPNNFACQPATSITDSTPSLLQVLRKHLTAVTEVNKLTKKVELYEKHINFINDEVERRRREKREAEEKKRQERLRDIKEKAKAKAFTANQRAATQARSREARASAVAARVRELTPSPSSSVGLTDDDLLDYDDANDPAWSPGSD